MCLIALIIHFNWPSLKSAKLIILQNTSKKSVQVIRALFILSWSVKNYEPVYYCTGLLFPFQCSLLIKIIPFLFRARGGVIVGNGIDNVASFKHYRVAPIDASEFIVQDCTGSTRSTQQYHILDAKHGRWPEDSFCRAISKKIVPGNNYLISAELFIQGWRTSDDENSFMGLAFNAKDPSNYDFVYVR